MTKLEELKAAYNAAWDACDAIKAAADAAEAAAWAVHVAYKDELKKTQKEKQND